MKALTYPPPEVQIPIWEQSWKIIPDIWETLATIIPDKVLNFKLNHLKLQNIKDILYC